MNDNIIPFRRTNYAGEAPQDIKGCIALVSSLQIEAERIGKIMVITEDQKGDTEMQVSGYAKIEALWIAERLRAWAMSDD